MLFVVIVGRMPLHVLEHTSQIRQFLTAAGVKVQPMPGDRSSRTVTRDGDPKNASTPQRSIPMVPGRVA